MDIKLISTGNIKIPAINTSAVPLLVVKNIPNISKGGII